MEKILICFGTRPEAIKMCSLVHELKKQHFLVEVCVTAQQRELLDQVLDFFQVIPDYDLDIMTQNQTLNLLSSKLFLEFEKVLNKSKPDLVLVHGDTTTSSICAWAAFNNKIKIGHVEAGLRTFNKYSPFPEEINRQITGRLSDFHFAPTELSKDNLLNEKIDLQNIIVTGNTVIDALFWTINKLESNFTNKIIEKLKSDIDFSKKIILVTSHRRENFGEGILNICQALIKISKLTDVEIIFPVHLNPNILEPVQKILKNNSNIHLITPLDYPSFVWVMKNSFLIITDSGGIQEEAPSIGKPVLVMRDTTERPEAIAAGTVKLVGTNVDVIYNSTMELINDKSLYAKMTMPKNPYGDGTANQKIINFLISKNLKSDS